LLDLISFAITVYLLVGTLIPRGRDVAASVHHCGLLGSMVSMEGLSPETYLELAIAVVSFCNYAVTYVAPAQLNIG